MAIFPKPNNRVQPRIQYTHFLLFVFTLLLIYLLYITFLLPSPRTTAVSFSSAPLILPPPPSPALSQEQILFCIASSSKSLPKRARYIRLWHNPISHLNTTFIFLERHIPNPPPSLPHIIIQSNSSSLSAGHRIARVVKEAVDLNIPGISWYVFGDDDTVFFTENLVSILSKYDHNKWYYVGHSSESYEQNEEFFFDMAFGGGGYAISASLAKVLSKVMDSCLGRYSHLYGSDGRVYACLAELGVGLTVEPGFHQVDIRGDLFGILSAHPLSLLASLHHFDAADPIFPHMKKIQDITHLFEAVHVDPARILQQTVCYDHVNSLTVSVSWGYAIQVYEGNRLLPELLLPWKTFRSWKKGMNTYMFKTRELPKNPCERPLTFFLDSVAVDTNGVWTNYTRDFDMNCTRANAVQKLSVISVFSLDLEVDMEEIKAPRRQCCDISATFDENMIIGIRKCGVDELIAMQVGLVNLLGI